MSALQVLLFAGLAETLQRRSVAIDGEPLPGTVGELRARLAADFPALGSAPFRVAVNQCYVDDATGIAPGDELALIPPVSGG